VNKLDYLTVRNIGGKE